jgi:hypothetical protein
VRALFRHSPFIFVTISQSPLRDFPARSLPQ